MKSVNKLVYTIIENGMQGPNGRGATLHRLFSQAERYLVDFAELFTEEGWEQYDTSQDAAYFGVWVNRGKWQILIYAEGDWTVVQAKSVEGYNAEIAAMNDFYEEGEIAKTLAANGALTIYKQDRSAFFIKDQANEI